MWLPQRRSLPKWQNGTLVILCHINSSFLQGHLEPPKAAAAERLSLTNINPLHCLSGIWHFRNVGLPSYLNCKYENGGTQQSERHSCEMRSLKAFLQCSKVSTLNQCPTVFWQFNIFLPGHATTFTLPSPIGMILVSDTVEEQREILQEDSCRAVFLLPSPVRMVRSYSLSHFCYGNTPIRSSTKEDLYCCGSCCGLSCSSTCRHTNVGVLGVLGAVWLQRNVSSLGSSLLSRCMLGRRHPAGRTRGWRPDRDTAAILGRKELIEE